MERIVFYECSQSCAGTTVERFLRRQGVSHRVLVDLKNTPNGLTLDGKPVRTIDRLRSEGKLRLCLPETDRSDTIPQADIALDIVYEDDDLVWPSIPPRKIGKTRSQTVWLRCTPHAKNPLSFVPSADWTKTPLG